MNLVLDQLKGVLSDSIGKFLKENIKLEDTDIKSIFGDNMDKVLYHDEGFVKELSNKMSDVVMPAYVKELRYLKKIVSGIDNVTVLLNELQERLAIDLRTIKPNPQNVDETIKQVNNAVEQFVKKANSIAKEKIGLREIEGSNEEGSSPSVLSQQAPITNAILKTPDDVSKAVVDSVKNNISELVKQKQSGGAQKRHALTVDNPIDNFLESDKKPVRIPKRNYNDYTGNSSSLFNQIIKEKMGNIEQTGLSNSTRNSESYKSAIDSMNQLFIKKPELKSEEINKLLDVIKKSKLSGDELQRIITKTISQINSVKPAGGTRKKRK